MRCGTIGSAILRRLDLERMSIAKWARTRAMLRAARRMAFRTRAAVER